MKKKSFVRHAALLLGLQVLVVSALLVLYVAFSWNSAKNTLESTNDNLMQLYSKELENKIEHAQNMLKQILYDSSDYILLQSDREADRYYATVRLKEKMEDLMSVEQHVDSLMIADTKYQQCLDVNSRILSFAQKEAIREFMMDYAGQEEQTAQWRISKFAGEYCIYKIYMWKGRAVGTFITVSTFMKTAASMDLSGMSILLTDDAGIVYGNYGSELKNPELGVSLDQLQDTSLQGFSYPLEDGELCLQCRFSRSSIFGQIRGSMVFFTGVLLLSFIVTFIIVSYSRREILRPMDQMTRQMEHMREGDYTLRITEDYKNSEFSLLKDTFNSLMDEIVGLKIKSYEKQIELQETELKCIRLQIRPHFFLNAMTTISSLSMQGRNEEITRYIDALSKNVRYMFKSGMHTVPLKEELAHVENYFAMQELKYPGCVFYMIEAEPGLENWPIPQMLVHTVVENAYKYAVSVEELLTILINVEKVRREDRGYLHIRIEDDGKGYDEELITAFAEKKNPVTESGNRVGLWSLAHMLELMYEEEGLFCIHNAEVHGCVTEFWIPEKVVVEIQ